jgi:hypothetical protein
MLEMALILCDYDKKLRGGRFGSCSTSPSSPRRWIAWAISTTRCGTRRDGFFYDVLRLPRAGPGLKVRSLVGCAACASTVFEEESVVRNPNLVELIAMARQRHPEWPRRSRRR